MEIESCEKKKLNRIEALLAKEKQKWFIAEENLLKKQLQIENAKNRIIQLDKIIKTQKTEIQGLKTMLRELK